MKFLVPVLLLGLCSLHIPGQEKPVADNSKSASPVVGNWLGELSVSGLKLRIAFKITEKDGKLFCMMDSLDQGAKDIAADKTSFENGTLKITWVKMLSVYEGKLSSDQKTLEGDFKQGITKMELKLARTEKLPTLNRPQTPKPPFPYKSEEVIYENTKAKIKLGATLTLPPGDGPFPVLLMITGSGAQDRDETLFEHKPFFVIADHCARHGIAVLRVDDRGVGKSTGNMATSDSFDFATDVEAGIEFLKTRKEIDQNRIGLCGHSEGGLIAPIVASRNKSVSFIILLAGTGIPGSDILLYQQKMLSASTGVKQEQIDKQIKLSKESFELLKTEPDISKFKDTMKERLKTYLASLTPEEKKELAKLGGETAVQQGLITMTSPWMKTFILYDPTTSLRKVTCPVFALNGEKDIQVPYQLNLPEIEKALKEGGNKSVKIKSYPNLNHLFQRSETGMPTEYSIIEETVSLEVLQDIVTWVRSVAK